ncbi:hypothetical protein B0H11DRAFT_1349099 [Mycena galericulata]|nr:hypothetical protein B0H11DRAFT_1349099 [Mycena galericulata]
MFSGNPAETLLNSGWQNTSDLATSRLYQRSLDHPSHYLHGACSHKTPEAINGPPADQGRRFAPGLFTSSYVGPYPSYLEPQDGFEWGQATYDLTVGPYKLGQTPIFTQAAWSPGSSETQDGIDPSLIFNMPDPTDEVEPTLLYEEESLLVPEPTSYYPPQPKLRKTAGSSRVRTKGKGKEWAEALHCTQPEPVASTSAASEPSLPSPFFSSTSGGRKRKIDADFEGESCTESKRQKKEVKEESPPPPSPRPTPVRQALRRAQATRAQSPAVFASASDDVDAPSIKSESSGSIYEESDEEFKVEERSTPKLRKKTKPPGARKRISQKRRRTHPSKNRPWCEDCDRSFGRKNDRDRHMNSAEHRATVRALHPNEDIEISSDVYWCDQCKKKYSREDALQRHQKTTKSCPYYPNGKPKETE